MYVEDKMSKPLPVPGARIGRHRSCGGWVVLIQRTEHAIVIECTVCGSTYIIPREELDGKEG